MHFKAFAKEWQVTADKADEKAAKLERKQIEHYDRSARILKPLKPGTTVLIQDPVSKKWDKSGSIVSTGPKRDYRIVTASGRVYWRNRRFIRPKILAKDTTDDGDRCDTDSEETMPRRSTREKKKVVHFQVG